MRLHIELGDRSRSTEIVIDDPDASVHDLAVALGLPTERALTVNGHLVAMHDRVADVGLVAGSTVGCDDSGVSADGEPVHIGVVAGLDSGHYVGVASGRSISIGRDEACDLSIANETVSGRHAVVTRAGDGGLSIEDSESRNGTWIGRIPVGQSAGVDLGDRVRLGSSVVSVSEWRVEDRPVGVSPEHCDERGRILLNRPPRALGPVAVPPIEVPSEVEARSNPVFSLVALSLPILFGGVMVVVLGSWRFALFALLSPLMLLGNYITNRRRVAKERAGDTKTHAEAMAAFERALTGAVDRERELRRVLAPDLMEVRRRVEVPSSRLWERRLDAPDAMILGLGRGELTFEPPLDRKPGIRASPDAEELVGQVSSIHDVELLADLRIGPVGIVGDSEMRLGSARSAVLQVATHHGPADVSIVVLTSAGRAVDWSWVQWLPHAQTPDSGVLVLEGASAEAFTTDLADALEAQGGLSPSASTPRSGWLLVVDDLAVLHGRSSPVRRLLERTDAGVFGLVLADTEDQLPASTATVVSIGDTDGSFARRMPGLDEPVDSGVVDTVTVSTAETIARRMARFEDPEMRSVGASLPPTLRPELILGEALESAAAVRRRWAASGDSTALRAPVGVTESGPLTLDLVHDGPHALVAGTTGAGKSEFLRTLVLALAASHGPDDLLFVLIDYKGGSAFDCCSRLPHVVGTVTDLDDHLAERALQSLEAELHHREKLLRGVQATDIVEYRRTLVSEEPLPRLVVIIDEFATLRAELPDFVDALVGIAQRGRSLGVHLVLATQRPSGALDANIRANTNLRVALRVQDAADSTDVIDTGQAALISRAHPGRAYVRRGNSDLLLAQTAYVSGPMSVAAGVPIRTAPVPLGSGAPPPFPDLMADPEAPTFLEAAVELITEASAAMAPPRRPWLDDLPPQVDIADIDSLESGDGAPVVLAVGDDPRNQRRVLLGWDPSDGALVAYGALGSGVSTLLRSCVARLKTGIGGRPVWVFAVDHGAGGLDGVEMSEHVACRLEPSHVREHKRLITMLVAMMDDRRTKPAEAARHLPLVVLVVDGLAGFMEVLDGPDSGAGDDFARIVRDGPAVGIVVVVGVTRAGEVPRSLATAVRTRFVMELADPTEYTLLGIKGRKLPTFRPGRVLVGSEPTVAQVIDWTPMADRLQVCDGPAPPVVDALPAEVKRKDLGARARIDPDLEIPFALDDRTRAAAVLRLRGGEHATIAGPARSGRSTALTTIASQLRDADPSLVLIGVAPSEQDDLLSLDIFDAVGTPESLDAVLTLAESDDRRWVVVVDDADRIDIEDGALVDLTRKAPVRVTIIVSVRSTTTRQLYGHWTRHARASGIGILLQPDNAVDGELLAVRLPRGARLDQLPGRGYLVAAGVASEVQIAIS